MEQPDRGLRRVFTFFYLSVYLSVCLSVCLPVSVCQSQCLNTQNPALNRDVPTLLTRNENSVLHVAQFATSLSSTHLSVAFTLISCSISSAFFHKSAFSLQKTKQGEKPLKFTPLNEAYITSGHLFMWYLQS